ncbi:TetR/AcrR family transcriptional regulator [Streptomyces sp. CG1]|uniref:TetR/AcrR family transcriptional regulator n=1 Tax=Streptomyces sp. CG1 TaxID=1287523 RepID=UPI0034E2B7AF
MARRDGVRPVTLTDIAAQARVHKSAVLRYFESREAAFLLLTSKGWQDWATAVGQALPGPMTPHDVAAALASTLAARPLF